MQHDRDWGWTFVATLLMNCFEWPLRLFEDGWMRRCQSTLTVVVALYGLGVGILLPDVAAQEAAFDWQKVSDAPWQARDSQAEYVFGGRMWVAGGWFNSQSAPPRDVWSSSNGVQWDLVTTDAPWIHSDLPMNLTYQGKMWMMGGWYNGRLAGHSAGNEVWASVDGLHWDQVTKSAEWSPRVASGAIEFLGKMWILGGTENYYFGDETSLKNDIWMSADGKSWKQIVVSAPWAPRAYHQVVVLGKRMYVIGGGDYAPQHHAKNDVWSSDDGIHWVEETGQAPWSPRIWFSSAIYRGRIWVMGGWSAATGNVGDVWHSADGKVWQRLETATCWKPRHEHSVFVHQDKLWIAGGHAQPLNSEVWSLELPVDWKP